MHHPLQYVADSINPLLVLALIFMPLRRELAAPRQFWVPAGVALALTKIVAMGIRHAHLVSERFPSTHFAFTLCAVTSLVLLNRARWLYWGALAATYGILMLYQGYHTPVEMLGAFYAIPLSWAVHRGKSYRVKEALSAGATGV